VFVSNRRPATPVGHALVFCLASSASARLAGARSSASIAASTVVIGARTVPSTCDSSTSRLGSAARREISFSSNSRPSTTAALIFGRSWALANSARMRAGDISLSAENTTPVGPTRNRSRSVIPCWLNARLMSVFLMTRNCTFS